MSGSRKKDKDEWLIVFVAFKSCYGGWLLVSASTFIQVLSKKCISKSSSNGEFVTVHIDLIIRDLFDGEHIYEVRLVDLTEMAGRELLQPVFKRVISQVFGCFGEDPGVISIGFDVFDARFFNSYVF